MRARRVVSRLAARSSTSILTARPASPAIRISASRLQATTDVLRDGRRAADASGPNSGASGAGAMALPAALSRPAPRPGQRDPTLGEERPAAEDTSVSAGGT